MNAHKVWEYYVEAVEVSEMLAAIQSAHKIDFPPELEELADIAYEVARKFDEDDEILPP